LIVRCTLRWPIDHSAAEKTVVVTDVRAERAGVPFYK
jgi:hypothetical protein